MSRELITFENAKSPVSEAFKTLRTNIQFMTSNKKLKTLLITSCIPGEGKSWTSSNLAVTFAQAGKRVLIIDADMRKGRLFNVFQVKPIPGLSNYLSGVTNIGAESEADIMEYIQETKIKKLYVIPAGSVPPNPSELLVSDKMEEMIQVLKNMFDIIIFDGTPSEILTDAIIISTLVDATILVSSYKKTKIAMLKKVAKNIQNVGGNVAGIVINRYPSMPKKYGEKYYGSNYNVPMKVKSNKKITVTKGTTKTKEKIQVEEKKEEKVVQNDTAVND